MSAIPKGRTALRTHDLSGTIPLAALAGRVLISAIFVFSGLAKFADWEGTSQHMASQGIPLVPLLLPAAALLEIVGGLAVLLGVGSRWAALALFLFLIPTTVIFHDFWTAVGAERQEQVFHLLKNLAIMGGLALLVGMGPGPANLCGWSAGRSSGA